VSRRTGGQQTDQIDPGGGCPTEPAAGRGGGRTTTMTTTHKEKTTWR